MKKHNQTDKKKPLKTFLIHGLSLLAIIAVWQLLSWLISSSIVLPSFSSTIKTLVKMPEKKEFLSGVLYSFLRVVKGFSISILAGTVIGTAAGLKPSFKTFIEIPLTVLRTTPVAAFILIALFIFDSAYVPVFSAFIMGIPVMTLSLIPAFDYSENKKKLFQMAEVYRFSKTQKIKFLYIPFIRPFFTGGAISTFGLCWKVSIAAEVISVPKNGLGALMQNAQLHLESRELLALAITTAVLCFVTEKLLTLAAKVPFTLPPSKTSFLRTASSAPSSEQKQNPKPRDLSLQNLTVKKGESLIYENFSITLEDCKITTILSPSGGGKTTLLDCIAKEAEKKGIFTSYIFQEPRLLESLTVYQNIYEPLKNQFVPSKSMELTARYLELTGLSDKSELYPHNLSGGEKQRVSIARAFAFNSSVLLLDEPFQSQDLHIKIKLMELLKNLLKESPKTAVFVTHDIHEASELSDRIIVIKDRPAKIVLDLDSTKTDKKDIAYKLFKIMI